MSAIGNFELSHTKTPHLLLMQPTPNDTLFSIVLMGWGQACSEQLDLPHFGQTNLALARN